MPKKKDYDTRRALVRDRIKTHPHATLTELSERSGYGLSYISDILRGRPDARSEPVVRAAEEYIKSL